MHTEITIRPFELRDQPAARRLILEGLGQHWGFIDESLNPDVDDIATNYLHKGFPFVVAESAEQLIGTGGLFIESNGSASVSAQMVRISVHRDCRRQGIGAQIVRHLV